MIYRIRAHHGMCFSFFLLKGYSGEFTENMWEMKKKLAQDPEVILCDETDDVCAHCPNNEEGVCISAEKADEYDRQVLARCGITVGCRIRWEEFARLVEERILSEGKREEICGDCQWTALCCASFKECKAAEAGWQEGRRFL